MMIGCAVANRLWKDVLNPTGAVPQRGLRALTSSESVDCSVEPAARLRARYLLELPSANLLLHPTLEVPVQCVELGVMQVAERHGLVVVRFARHAGHSAVVRCAVSPAARYAAGQRSHEG